MPFSNIDKPSKYFDITLFTGNNASGRTFTGLNFPPDMIWGKSRDTANLNHQIVDIVRGGTKFLFTNSTLAEDTASHGQITSWNSDGTTWADGTNGTYPRLYYNDNGQLGGSGSRVWWQWKANGTGVSNTSGTISSTVSANTTSGFSIVSYTGNGTNGATIGHGLGVVPKMFIIKERTDVNPWVVYHASVDVTGDFTLRLNETSAKANGNNTNNDTAPTSSLITLGTSSLTNGSSKTYIAYCFADVKGFSKYGGYTGNGASGNGTFIYTGFRPAFVMIKETSGIDGWGMFDNKRVPYNYVNTHVQAQSTSADITNTADAVDFLSNGFKVATGTSSANFINESGASYIYMAIAEQPFVSAKGIVANAR